MNKIKSALCVIIPLLLIFFCNKKIGDVPPVLKFLNPFMGFWQNAERSGLANEKISIPGAKDSISILFDDKMVPHIFATNDRDLYLAQGYVTAMHRLWQMDFQTRYAAGRISEVVGQSAVEIDRYQRRMGLVYGAENSLKGMMSDEKSREMVLAYTDGVNAYINSLSEGDYPIEFKLLDYKPELWTPIKCALLLKQMSAALAMGSNEFYMSNILQKFGNQVTEDLFPDYPFREDPMIPAGTKWDFSTLPVPAAPAFPAEQTKTNVKTHEKVEGIGSNNWAISGEKSLSGKPILANDPHLMLTLPSLWYQIQLHTTKGNTYGVSLPGAPGIVIGFNEKIAWGVTNVAADVLDFYQIRFKDKQRQMYWYNNAWAPVKKRVEQILTRAGTPVIDTVYYTHHGPIVYFKKPSYQLADNVPTGSALRWVVHDESNELLTFYHLNHATNYADYRKALTFYSAPAQNFIFASKENDIAITAAGKFPLKWKNQGKFLLDGSRPENDWHGRIPASQNPNVKNPERKFVSSANQSPTDQSYPYYINWEFEPYERGKRINQLLGKMNGATVDTMRKMQLDSYSILAENILPVLLKNLEKEQLSPAERKAYDYLRTWNKRYDAHEPAATIFDVMAERLFYEIWDDEFTDKGVPMRYPSRDRTVELLLNDPASSYFDNVKTKEKETLQHLIRKSLKFSLDTLTKKMGTIGDKWAWAAYKRTNVAHMAKIPGFGSKDLDIGGAKGTINSLNGFHGPSWRMVVEMGETPKGYGIYPGGQSGNPGSRFYDNMIDTWAAGELNELLFLKDKKDQSKKIIKQLEISK